MKSMGFTKVLQNSFFYTVARILQGTIGFILLPIYTRYLTPENYAILALVTSFVAIASSIITLQIHSGIFRFVIKFIKDENRAKSYFSSIFLLLLTLLIFGCLVINVFGERMIKLIFSNDNINYVPFFQIATWTLLPNLLISGGLMLLQALERGAKFFLVVLVQVAVNLCFGLFFVVVLKLEVMGVLLAQLISAICGLIFIIWLIRDWIWLNLSKIPIHDISDSLRYSLPIIPHMLGMYIYMYSDRIILERFVPLADIGIYSVADTFAFILLAIVNSTTAAYSPRFLKIAEESETEARNEAKRFIKIWWGGIMMIFMGYFLFTGMVVKIMTPPSFYAAIPLIPILASAYIFRGLYCFATNGIFFSEKTKYIPIITITAGLINIVLNLIFIPRYGVFAAVWTTVVSYLFTFILAYYFSKKTFPIVFPWNSMLRVAALFLVTYSIVRFFANAVSSNTLFRFSFNVMMFIFFSAATIFILYRKPYREFRTIRD